MSPNAAGPSLVSARPGRCGEILPSAHLECAERVQVKAKKKNLPAALGKSRRYMPDPATLSKAVTCLRAAGKILPSKLAAKIGIHRNTAAKLCIDLYQQGKLIRVGRGYEWNPIGATVSGPMDPIYQARALELLELVEGTIRHHGLHDRHLAYSYRNGEVSSTFEKRLWTDTLVKIRTKLRNCLKVQNPILLLDIEREIALDIPTWAGDLYKRSGYAQQQLTEERKMAYAARKPRKVDEAFHAERQAKVDAIAAAARVARAEATRLLQAQAEALLLQMSTATEQGKLGIAMQIIQLVGPEKAQRFMPTAPAIPAVNQNDGMEE